ncbi:unnamed protein product [Paramecium primaurelia]|uniref:Dolichol-phosphate mannosyltransferase subunit 3 n=1 Tax=Paramecium primaurelia TaxID=5886 RepID=A0A8S1MW52_PARPR|nr:unnamed protein product [Paramecium primaurelia]
MSRGTNLFVAFSISIIIWIITLFLSTGYVKEITKSIPTYALILYFSYALFKVGGDLAQLKDYPEEAQSLQKEVEQAKRFYQEKGLKL